MKLWNISNEQAAHYIYILNTAQYYCKLLISCVVYFPDPPDPPYIEGYTEGETIKRSQVVELMCRSRGGNPPAQLVWYRNDEIRRVQYR